MGNRPMVPLITVTGVFHGRVVAARLGADGILTELRGDVGGTYPLGGAVRVFVEADQAEAARHILLADEAAAALDASVPETPRRPRRRLLRLGGHSLWLYLAWTLLSMLIALYLMASFG